MGIAPTSKPIDVRAVNLDQIADGLIVARWSLIDMMAMLIQIGAPRTRRVARRSAWSRKTTTTTPEIRGTTDSSTAGAQP